jgi:uncharacterized membrane protein (UPF0127 family)
MKQALMVAFVLLVACPALAQQQGVFVYSKTILKIIPKPSDPAATASNGKEPAEKTDNALGNIMMPDLKRAPKEFKVEVRDPSFLEIRDFIVHQPFADKEGMIILIDPPQQMQLKATRMIASADVLFVDVDGNIFKIAPALNLSNLSEPIDSGRPLHAYVFLKSGMAAASDIQIGDRIENASFKTHPVVIQ